MTPDVTWDQQSRYMLVRAQDNTLTSSWSRDGSLLTPVPGTVSVFDATGAAVVSEEPFTVSADVASYTIPAATLPASRQLEQGWLVRWTSNVGGLGVRQYVQEAALVRYMLYPPVTQSQLYRRVQQLNTAHASAIIGTMDLQDKLDEAWLDIEDRLYNEGRRPQLIMTPSAFRAPYTNLALALIFEDLRTANWEAYNEIAAEYRQRYHDAWGSAQFAYDSDQDGQIDGGGEPDRVGAQGTYWLQSRGGGSWP